MSLSSSWSGLHGGYIEAGESVAGYEGGGVSGMEVLGAGWEEL